MEESTPTASGAGSSWERLSTRVLSPQQVRRVDALAIQEYGMNSLVLMENAALGCVHWLRTKYPQRPDTVILCGSGNNGGDGLAIARHLGSLGWKCKCFVLGPVEKLSDDCRANLEILRQGDQANSPNLIQRQDSNDTEYSEVARSLKSAGLIIDAMLGTGSRGAPRSPLEEWITMSNLSSAKRVAIDIPTGIDGETGEQAGVAFHPDATLTFVARKPAMALSKEGFDTASVFGEIMVLPIGTPSSLNERVLSW